MTFLKKIGYVGLSYLILRELPIRNFYARSVIWALIGFWVSRFYRYDTWDNCVVDKYVM